jgi:hypothetical protein
MKETGGNNMRRYVVFFLLPIIVTLLYFERSSAGQFGAPEPISAPGKVTVGIGYFHNNNQWKLNSDSKEHAMIQNQYYLQLNYAVVRDIEVFLRGGASDMNFDNAFNSGIATGNQNISGTQPDLNDHSKLFGTIGARSNIAINQWLSLGPVIQASLFSSYSDTAAGSVSGTVANQSGSIHGMYEIAAAFFLQDKFKIDDTQNWVRVYAGPFLYWGQAKFDTSMASAGT